MIAILSPARTIVQADRPGLPLTKPHLLEKTVQLARLLRQYSPWELEGLLKANPALALQAFDSYRQFDPAAAGSPAILSYRGLAFSHLGAAGLSQEELLYGNGHLRILSAFYGILRPLDGMQPYRLEMLGRWRVEGKSLYAFWGDSVRNSLFSTGEPVVNLCSEEYAKLVVPHLKSGDRFLTCRFLELRRGRLRCIATSAKAARGRMARFLIRRRLQSPEELKAFEWEEFCYSPELSSPEEYVFARGMGNG